VNWRKNKRLKIRETVSLNEKKLQQDCHNTLEPCIIMPCHHRDTFVETACRLCSGSYMGLIYCCPIKLGGEISNYTGFLPSHSLPLPLPSSLPFSMPVLGECQILTLEAPLITDKTPCMYNGYIYNKDDVRSPFVKPPCLPWVKEPNDIAISMEG
jgi:hypothetical protein